MSASIMRKLVPKLGEVERFNSETVDFCVVLKFYEGSESGVQIAGKDIHRELRNKGVEYLNHTAYSLVDERPIAVSIASANGEGNRTALKVRLATWASAQISHIHRLIKRTGSNPLFDDPMIPPLPLVSVHGHTWSLYYLEHDFNGQCAVLWDCGEFGSTESVLGACQVVACLQILMHWAEKIYRPWFEETILRPFLGGIERSQE
jgi:hypothetical protein